MKFPIVKPFTLPILIPLGPKYSPQEYRILRLHKEKLHSSPNIVRVIKCRRLRWAAHVSRLEEGRSDFKIVTGKPTGMT